MWTLILYLVAGIIYDVLVTLYYCFVVDGKVIGSSLTSAMLTFFAYTVLYFLILTPNALWNILAYSIGCGVGAGIVVWKRNGNGACTCGEEE